MLGVNLWKSANSALQMIDAMASQTSQAMAEAVAGEEDAEISVREETYKKLLEEAQMQHVEMSKISRSVLADRDAELSVLRQKIEELTGAPVKADSMRKEFDAAKAEQQMEAQQDLINSLGEQLREALVQRDALKATAEEAVQLRDTVATLRAEVTSLTESMSAMTAEKNETIDNLVDEYSKLAADSELRQVEDERRLQQVTAENEVLVTKMAVLESNISELADKAVEGAPGSGSGNARRAADKGGTGAAAKADDVNAGSAVELKDAKAKLVRVQNDNRELSERVAQLVGEVEALNLLMKVQKGQQQSSSAQQQQQLKQNAANSEAIQAYTGQIHTLQQTLLAQEQAHEDQCAQWEAERAQLLAQVEEAAAMAAPVDSLADSISLPQAAVDPTTTPEYAALVQECERLQGENEMLMSKCSDLVATKQANKSLTAKCDELEAGAKQERDELQQAKGALTSKCSELEATLTTVRQECTDLAKANEAIKKQHELLMQNSIKANNAEKDKLSAMTKAMQAKMEEQARDLGAVHAQELREAVATATAKAAMQAGGDAAQQQEAAVASLMNEHKAQVSSMQTTMDELKEQHKSEVSSMQTTIVELKEQHAKDLEAAAAKNRTEDLAEALKAAKADHDATIALLEQKMADAAAEHTTQLEAAVEREASEQQAKAKAALKEKMAALEGTFDKKLQSTADRMAKDSEAAVRAAVAEQQQAAEVALQTQLSEQKARCDEELQRTVKSLSVEGNDLVADAIAAQQADKAEELARQAVRLQEQHDLAMKAAAESHEREKAEAVSETFVKQVAVADGRVEARTVEMEAAHAAELQETETRLLKDKEAAVAASIAEQVSVADGRVEARTAELKAAHAAELQETETRLLKDKEAALAALVKKSASELSALRSQSAAELAAAKDKAAADLSTLKVETDARIAEQQKEVDVAQQNLANVEERYEVKLRESVQRVRDEKEAERKHDVEVQRVAMQALVDEADKRREEYLQLYTKERMLRKAIHNKLIDIQGNIRVICRVRPVLAVERRKSAGDAVDVTTYGLTDEEIIIQRDEVSRQKFEFDKVFQANSSQLDVFEAVQPLCVSVLDGYNVCIFAYGQTGSGKTFTMEGSATSLDESGISPRALRELVRITQEELTSEWTYTLSFSMMEIYNETIRDLLIGANGGSAAAGTVANKLDVRQTSEGNIVPGLVEVRLTSADQIPQLMGVGNSNRAVGGHDMNEHSSRSHSIITVVCRGKNSKDGSTTFGKLHLIDLAGSERISKTDATGDRLKEAQNINKSLSALGDVINALGNKKVTHIPYRNSKLTFLLQDSLGGQSKVLMCVNVSPAVYNVNETVCSLTFAARCRATELGQATAKKTSGVAQLTAGPAPASGFVSSAIHSGSDSGASSRSNSPPRSAIAPSAGASASGLIVPPPPAPPQLSATTTSALGTRIIRPPLSSIRK